MKINIFCEHINSSVDQKIKMFWTSFRCGIVAVIFFISLEADRYANFMSVLWVEHSCELLLLLYLCIMSFVHHSLSEWKAPAGMKCIF